MYFNFQYLNSLIDEVKEVRENFEIHKLNTNLYSVTYLPTKRQAFIGIKSGYAEKILFYSFF